MKFPSLFAAVLVALPAIAQDEATHAVDVPEAPDIAAAPPVDAAMGDGLALMAPIEATEDHLWLQKFVGDWEFSGTCHMGPEGEPTEGSGTETVTTVGDLWIVAEGEGQMGPMSMQHVLTVGYDTEAEEYLATWVDSFTGKLWQYTGSREGDTLTLEVEGTCPMTGEHTEFRDTTTFVDADTRTIKSEMKGPDGEWVTMMEGEATRVSVPDAAEPAADETDETADMSEEGSTEDAVESESETKVEMTESC